MISLEANRISKTYNNEEASLKLAVKSTPELKKALNFRFKTNRASRITSVM